jgi:hypothetical protein
VLPGAVPVHAADANLTSSAFHSEALDSL